MPPPDPARDALPDRSAAAGLDPVGENPWNRVGPSLQGLRSLLVCDGASVWLPLSSPPAPRLVPAQGWGVGFDVPGRTEPLRLLVEAMVAEAPASPGDRLADSSGDSAVLRGRLEQAGLGSVLLRPLSAAGAPPGWLCIHSRHPGFFTTARIGTLDQAYPGVAVAALAALLQASGACRGIPSELQGILSEAPDWPTGCRTALEALCRRLGLPGAAILTRDNQDQYHLRALAGESASNLTVERPVAAPASLLLEEAQHGGVIRMDHQDPLASALFDSPPPDACPLAVPLRAASRFLGYLILLVDGVEEAGRVPDPESLSALGLELGLALESLRLVEDRAHSLKTSRQLLKLSHEVSSVLDLSHVPRLVAEYASAVCEADECVLFLLAEDGETLFPVVYLGAFEEQVLQVRPRLGQGITGWVGQTRQAEIANHAETDPRAGYIPGTPVEPEAILAVPMVVADKLIGVLTLYKLEGRTFQDPDLDAVNIFSTQAAIALVNARLFSSVQQERGRLVTMLEHMKEGVVFGDKDGRVLLMNSAATTMLELESSTVAGAPIEDLLAAGDFEPLRADFIEVREARSGHVHGEHRIRGNNYMVSISSVPGGENGDVLGQVLLLQDTTQHKRIEAQLMESNKMSAVGQLAGGVAHEFNNLITGIYGYAQLIQLNPTSEAARRGVDVILKSSERAQGLTNSLLTFSRRRPGRREPVEIDTMLEDTLLLLARQFEKAKIRVLKETKGLPPVVADGGEIQQVFFNLLINALQALPEGGEVRITGRAHAGQVELEVTDNGPGIPPENLSRVFDPFFSTRGPLGGAGAHGTGLGLTTAYNILKDHGGALEARSMEGEGATFIVRIPLELAAGGRPGTRSAGPSAEDATVVILGDQEDEGQEIARILTELGHEAIRTPRIQGALEIMTSKSLHLIVLNGPLKIDEASDYARIRAADPHLPILFLCERAPDTEFPGLSDRWAFLLRKPYRNRDLAAMASRLIARRLPAAS